MSQLETNYFERLVDQLWEAGEEDTAEFHAVKVGTGMEALQNYAWASGWKSVASMMKEVIGKRLPIRVLGDWYPLGRDDKVLVSEDEVESRFIGRVGGFGSNSWTVRKAHLMSVTGVGVVMKHKDYIRWFA